MTLMLVAFLAFGLGWYLSAHGETVKSRLHSAARNDIKAAHQDLNRASVSNDVAEIKAAAGRAVVRFRKWL